MHEALLAELGIGACDVLAHDIGDSVGQELLARQVGSELRHDLGIRSIAWLNGGMFYEAYTPRLVQRVLSGSSVGDLVARALRGPVARRTVERTMGELFGPRTQPTPEELDRMFELLAYRDGLRVTHRVGRFVLDRREHRNRWVRAMRETGTPMRLIDGPFDPNSGRHMADRYRELVPDADVVLLGDQIGHWPQLEDPEGVLRHYLDFVDARGD
jgi:pimeloyl-ACP methyl ester carboxylesterase